MRINFRSERGQTAGFVAIAMVALVAMTAFVLDVGSWFRADRQLQSVADAAALAGAQALPEDPAKAIALAETYAEQNGGPDAETMAIEKDLAPNDTIRVVYSDAAPGFFSKVFGIGSVTVRAKAKARASGLAGARWVAPITVSEKHPLLRCTAPGKCDPDTETEATLDIVNLHDPGSGDAAGAFGLINLVPDDKGTVGESTLAGWMSKGYDQMMKPGVYNSVPSAMYNSSSFQSALDGHVEAGDVLLFPIYRTIVKSGSTAEYTIVGWVPFVITSVTGGGDSAQIHGHFTDAIWDGIPASSSTPATPGYGAKVVSLTD